MNILKKKTGFTLTEILVVLIIIAILSAGGIPFYKDHIERQKAASSITTLRAIADSLERYLVLHKNTNRDFTLLDMEIDRSKLSDDKMKFNNGIFTYSIDYTGDMTEANKYAIVRGKRNTGEYELIFSVRNATISCTCEENSDICEKLGLQEPIEEELEEEEEDLTPDTSAGRN